MTVAIYTINKGQSTQYFGLKNVEDNQVLYSAPNHWKTKQGALNWAKKHEFEIKEENTMADKIRLTLTDNAYYSYNSKSTEPNNWVCCPATDRNGTVYACYYHVEDGTELEDVDYYAPDCIVNEDNGKTVELDFVEIV